MYVLQCGDFSDIISWTDNGSAFKVVDPSKLEDTVLPAIFKDAKFSSFRRKASAGNSCFVHSKGCTRSINADFTNLSD